MPTLNLLLLCALVLAAVSVGALFVGRARRPRWGTAARAVTAATAVGLAGLGSAALVGGSPWQGLAVGGVLAAAVLVNGPVASAWTMRGLLAWSTSLVASGAYLVVVLRWMLETDLSALGHVAAALLWALEGFVFLLSVGYLWELVDVQARWSWQRRIELREELARTGAHEAEQRPFVSLHVPTHNEPPDLVVATLQRLLALEYDAYEVLVVDNNTDDPALWRPVAEFCERHDRLRFFHLEDWPGYKSGALNHALEQVDPRTELVGVVDADYLVEPGFLRRVAPLFSDADLGFVQSPQDYRDWETDSYFRRLYYSYAYFFDVSQRSRNERNGAIFGGTMGLIRRSALAEVGGWDEWCITEDAELSLRLLRAGWEGSHVEESFGRGIMPLTFEALKRQRFRWCFGGVQILRLHWRALLPGRRTVRNRLSLGQRWAYLVGALQWFGDLAGLGFTAFLLLGAVNAALGEGLVVRRLSGVLLVCVVGLVLLGALRSVALVRRASGAGWRDAVGAFGLWLALGWVVALASVRGLVAREGAFLRTPKFRDDVSWRDALRGNLVEALLAGLCLLGGGLALTAGSTGGAVVAGLLLLQGTSYALAPWNSLAAVRADLTPELRRRRREKLLSWTRVAPGVRRWGIGPAVAAVLGAVTVTLLAAPVGSPQLSELARPDTSTTSPTPTPSPSPARTTAPSTPSRTPTAAPTTATAARTTSPAPATTRATRRPSIAPSTTSTPTARARLDNGRSTTRPTTLPTKPLHP